MKKLYTLLFFTCFANILFAQKEANNWYFGVYAGLNFNTNPTTVLTDGTLVTPEGCATISDTAGNLLFYTDGITVWNSQHTLMPNGSGLLAGSSSTQAVLIAKQPGSETIYYVFTTDEIGGPNGFQYSIVDMSLQSGLGDVTIKNFPIQTPVTEKLTGVTNFDSTKTWIIVHDWGSNNFYSYELTASGFNLTPVISNTGTIHNTSVIQNTYGQMKFSSCGNRLALAIGYQDIVELFDFNIITGVVSNPTTLPFGDHVYGVEFSPDNTKLYVTSYDEEQTLVQFDVTLSTAADILASLTIISITPDLYGMQLAPDGYIYVVPSYTSHLNAITDPNMPGLSCAYIENTINLDPNYIGASTAITLPNFVQSYFDYGHKGCTVPTANEQIEKGKISIYPNPSQGIVYVSDLTDNSMITVFDVAGRERFEFDSHGNSASPVKIDLSNLESGVYLLRVNSGDKHSSTKIFIEPLH
jgi:hypothetical protein